MSDEERLELCKKLDKDLDNFIESLPKKKQEDGGPEENWLEEFEKHPFFMKQAPEEGQEMHPLYEGLQQLKYDPLENTSDELAVSYKDDGNFNFKHKNYRLAIIAYTEGLRAKPSDPNIRSSLYNNRSASNYFLKNYRSSINDCNEALKLNPTYEKVLIRAMQCCLAIDRFDEGLEYAGRVEKNSEDKKEIVELKTKLMNGLKLKERNLRREEAKKRHKNKEESAVLREIGKRNINIELKHNTLNIAQLEPNFPELAHRPVCLDSNNRLYWPVVFMYPEYKIMDFIQDFCEDDIFFDHILDVFQEVPPWDEQKKYLPHALNVYYENQKIERIFKVDTSKRLGDILSERSFMLRGGTPCFIIVAKNTPAEKILEQYF